MKKRTILPRFILMLGGIFFTMSACKKSNSNPASAGTLSATIDGTNWNASSVSANGDGNGQFAIDGKGNNDSYPQMLIVFPDTVSSGNTVLIGPTAGLTYYVCSCLNNFGALSGSIAITEYDKSAKRIEGTFNAVAVNGTTSSKRITNGQFAVNYH